MLAVCFTARQLWLFPSCRPSGPVRVHCYFILLSGCIFFYSQILAAFTKKIVCFHNQVLRTCILHCSIGHVLWPGHVSENLWMLRHLVISHKVVLDCNQYFCELWPRRKQMRHAVLGYLANNKRDLPRQILRYAYPASLAYDGSVFMSGPFAEWL